MRLFQTLVWCHSGGVGTRGAGGTVVESLLERRSTRKSVLLHALLGK